MVFHSHGELSENKQRTFIAMAAGTPTRELKFIDQYKVRVKLIKTVLTKLFLAQVTARACVPYPRQNQLEMNQEL